MAALVAAGYEVFAINPKATARYRERHSISGAKSDPGDAHVLAEIVRLDRAHHRPVAGDTADGEAIKLVARSHQTMIWERTRHVLRLRSTLREYFPAALDTFADLDEPDALELLAAAPDPDRAARLTKAKITGALKRARRRNIADRAVEIQQSLRAEALRQPAAVQTAFAAITVSEVRLITALNSEIDTLGEVVGEHFGRHPDAEIYASQPGLGVILGARVLAEFGDDPHRFADAQSPQELRRHLTDHQSLRHQEERAGPLRHATPAWPMRCSSGRCPHCADHPAPAPTTTNCAPGRSATKPRCAGWPTATSASCTAA